MSSKDHVQGPGGKKSEQLKKKKKKTYKQMFQLTGRQQYAN